VILFALKVINRRRSITDCLLLNSRFREPPGQKLHWTHVVPKDTLLNRVVVACRYLEREYKLDKPLSNLYPWIAQDLSGELVQHERDLLPDV
jgi:hypothetical protein